jgi:hypothetical protein
MALKPYGSEQSNLSQASIPSGVESGDSKNELLIVEPFVRHPQIPGLYRAVDPETGWRGWVEYQEPTV